MKQAILFLLIMSAFGCGYRVVSLPASPVYLHAVDNRTDRSAMGAMLDQALAARLAADQWLITSDPEPDGFSVRIQLTTAGSGTLQSGNDSRVTISRDIVQLSATITGPDGTSHHSIQFPLMNRFSESSVYHVDDREREEKELAQRMAMQVASWLRAPSTS